MPKVEQEYIGDGAYARYDGYSFWISTSDGLNVTNQVCLEPEVLKSFLQYVKKIAGTNEELRIYLAHLMLLEKKND